MAGVRWRDDGQGDVFEARLVQGYRDRLAGGRRVLGFPEHIIAGDGGAVFR